MSVTRQTFAKRFVAARERLGLSNWAAANCLGVMVERLRSIEMAEETPDSSVLEKAITHYDLSLDYFFEQDDAIASKLLNLDLVTTVARRIVVGLKDKARELRELNWLEEAFLDVVRRTDYYVEDIARREAGVKRTSLTSWALPMTDEERLGVAKVARWLDDCGLTNHASQVRYAAGLPDAPQ